MPYIYMLRCEDQSLYTGIAKDIRQRICAQYYKKKTAAKYTKSHPMKALEMVWETDNWSEAGRLEYYIKQLRREKKEELLLHPELVNQIDKGKYKPCREITLEVCLAKEEDSNGQVETAVGISDGD